MDEADYLRSAEYNEFKEDVKEPILRVLKEGLFRVFLRINSAKMNVGKYYHVLLMGIETAHLLSLVLNDGSYSAMGPYEGDMSWNHTQSQWLIDLCWFLRIDHYLRTSLAQYIALMSIYAGLTALLLICCLFLALHSKTTILTDIACKVAKCLLTLFTTTLYIPICDCFVFGMKCALSGGDQCLGITTGFGAMFGFICSLSVFLLICSIGAVLHYDICMICGNIMAKPHPRVKFLRLGYYLVMIMMYYFIDIAGKIVLFLCFSIVLTVLLGYLYAHYLPYYNIWICKLKLAGLTIYLSALICMLIGEGFKSTDQSRSSVSMLFYFLTPCLIQILLLTTSRRCQILLSRKPTQITNMYQVEIKGRLLVWQLENARSQLVKSVNEDEKNLEFQTLETQTLEELESLYLSAFRKFPNSEYLYLWSGLLQLHIHRNYILAMVHSFRGLGIANKLDSQYALTHFRKTSEAMYMANMKDDAYQFVQFEKCSAAAQRWDETVTRAQFQLWSSLESRSPSFPKLLKLSSELSTVVTRTKFLYEELLRLNSKSSIAMRMFGGFLQSLSGYAEMGDRYLQKAEGLDNPENAGGNTNVPVSFSQSLSFFEASNAIITVSGDFEAIGEIIKANVPASTLFGYLQAEFIGRNIALVIPEPFACVHDENMRKFHETGRYSTIDLPNLTLYFLNKSGYLFEAQILIKVVPNSNNPPFFLAAIRHKPSSSELAMLTTDWILTGYSQGFSDMFELGTPKNKDYHINRLIPRFEENKEKMRQTGWEMEGSQGKVVCGLTLLKIGTYEAYVLKVTPVRSGEGGKSGDSASPRPLEPSPTVSPVSSAPTPSNKVIFTAHSSEESSESESDESESDDSDKSSSESMSQTEQVSNKKITFNAEKMTGEGEVKGGKGNLSYSDEPDILYEEKSEKSEMSAEQQSEQAEGQGDISHQGSFSASSKNSSMASSAHFTKSIRALMSYQFSIIRHHVLRFQITLFVTMLVLIATSISTFQVIQASVEFNEQLSHYVNLVGRLRMNAQSLSYYSRILSLIDSSYLPSFNRSTYESWMTTDLNDMHSISLQLYHHFGLLSTQDRSQYFEENIPIWLMEGGRIVSEKANLFDATENMVVQAFLMLGEKGKYSASNRRLFYLYRNGLGETVERINKSTQFYVNAASANVASQRLISISLILLSILLLLLCTFLAILPALKSLEKTKTELWEIFFEIPVYVCRIMRSKCGDRLTILNEAANLEMEEMNPEAGLELDQTPETTHTPTTTTQKKGAKGENRRNRRKEIKAAALTYDSKARKIVLVKIGAFLVINVVYFYMIYYTGFEAAGELLREEPTTVDWASRRRHLSRAINHWVTESLLENVTNVGYKYQIPSGQPLSSPSHYAFSLLTELEYVENSLIFGNKDYPIAFANIRSTEHDSLMFTDACSLSQNRSESDCNSVANEALSQGLHSAIGMYVALARTVLIGMERKGEVREKLGYGDMAVLRSLDERYLYDALEKSCELYETDFSASFSHLHIYQNLLISLYLICSVLFYLLIYHPLIRNLGNEARSSWSLCALLPQEYQEEFRKLNSVIKEKRDRFKWR